MFPYQPRCLLIGINRKIFLHFMQNVYAMNEVEKRKLRFLYHQSAIETRYSVLPDYSLNADEWQFYPASENLEPFLTWN